MPAPPCGIICNRLKAGKVIPFLGAGASYPADRKDIANAILWWPHGAAQPEVKAPNELDIDLAKTTVIYKMHGTIIPAADEWDNFVITEEDYVEFLALDEFASKMRERLGR